MWSRGFMNALQTLVAERLQMNAWSSEGRMSCWTAPWIETLYSAGDEQRRFQKTSKENSSGKNIVVLPGITKCVLIIKTFKIYNKDRQKSDLDWSHQSFLFLLLSSKKYSLCARKKIDMIQNMQEYFFSTEWLSFSPNILKTCQQKKQ